MRSEHDVTADAIYVHVIEAPIDHTEELEDGTIVDVSADGELVGVEILSASKGWSPDLVASKFHLSGFDRDALRAIAAPPRVGMSGILGVESRGSRPTDAIAGLHTLAAAGC